MQKKSLVCQADEYENLDIICNAGYDSAICDLPQAPTGKRGRPAKRGKRLSPAEDFSLSAEKIGDYYVGVRKVLTNIFGDRCVHAYVTAGNKTTETRRLFFSTVTPEAIHMACAWQEKGYRDIGQSDQCFVLCNENIAIQRRNILPI